MCVEQPDDALLTTAASPKVITKGLEADSYAIVPLGIHLGVRSLSPGWARSSIIVRRFNAGVPATSYRDTDRKIGWARELATPLAKDMPTVNNDTFS